MLPVSGESLEFLNQNLGPEDRVLVTGAGGWFGTTLAAMLKMTRAQTMFITQRPRSISWGVSEVSAIVWDWEKIVDFSPTMIVDCAFILRDYLGDMPLEVYIAENQKLTSKLMKLVSLDSVTSVIYVSSGAAVHPSDSLNVGIEINPYGHIKRTTELALLKIGEELSKKTLIARPYSLSGRLVTRPDRYAFSNLILQARLGNIQIKAEHEVWRRYISVEDFFGVSIATAKTTSGYLNSGGKLVEFSELAQLIVSTLGLSIPIERPVRTSLNSDSYYSTDASWTDACSFLGYTPADLETQIKDVDRYLTSNPV